MTARRFCSGAAQAQISLNQVGLGSLSLLTANEVSPFEGEPTAFPKSTSKADR